MPDNGNKRNTPGSGKEPRRREAKKPGFKINLACLAVFASVFFALALLNLFQPERPEISAKENRALASKPEFSFASLVDGSYFSGWSSFISDTFWQRESLIDLARGIDKLSGVAYVKDGVEWIIDSGKTAETTGEEEETAYIPDITWDDETEPATDPIPDVTTEEIIEPGPEQTTDDVTPDESTEPEVTTPEPFEVRALRLSMSSIEMIEGGSALLTATLTTVGEGTAPDIVWSVSDPSLLDLTPSGTSSVSLYAKKTGTARVTASCAGLVATCDVTVKQNENPAVTPVDDVALIPENTTYFTYNGAIYATVKHNDATLKAWAQSYNGLLTQYRRLFPDARISVIIVPESSALLDNTKVTQAGRNQGDEIAEMAKYIDSSFNFINIYGKIREHSSELLYFKSDNHWTGLGAYYGYCGFMESIGETPVPLSDFRHKIITENFKGYLAKKFNKNITDLLEAYVPTKKVSTTVTFVPNDNLPPTTYSKVIWETYTSYLAFLSGDRPLVQIKVPDNPQDRKVLVIKDSFGNAFAPYLTMHYGNITVVDPRHYFSSFNQTIQEQFKDYGFTDIIFIDDLLKNQTNWVMKELYPLIGIKP